MAVPTSYLKSTKNLAGILGALQKAGVPPKFTYDFLKTLGYPSSNDRSLIPVLKSLRFIDQSGIPLDRYKRFRDSGQSRAVMAEGMRDAYSDVFAVDQDAQNMSTQDLQGAFARLSGKSDSVAEKMATTFKALATHADFAASPSTNGDSALLQGARLAILDPAPEPQEDVERRPLRPLQPLQLHHDIHVHLPPGGDVDVYDAIFRALQQNFGDT
jgi:hypothetical protein